MQHPSHSTHVYHDIAKIVGLVPACVYGAIHWRAHLEHEACHASYATIGEELNIDERTVRRAVQTLVDAELIVLHLNPGGTNYFTLNEATPDNLTETPDKLSPELTSQLNKLSATEENKEPSVARDASPPPISQNPPKSKTQKPGYWRDVEDLVKHFSGVTHIPVPVLGTKPKFAAANRLWRDPLGEIYALSNDIPTAKQLITDAVREMAELTISSPGSIVKVAVSIHAKRLRGERRYRPGQFADFWDTDEKHDGFWDSEPAPPSERSGAMPIGKVEI